MSNVKVGYRGKEIDFLAVNPVTNRRVHVEVHASVFPLAPLRAWRSAKFGKEPINERMRHYYNNKFIGATKEGSGKLLNRCVEYRAAEKLGSKDYERWLVLGKLHKRDSEDEIKKEFTKLGGEVFFVKDILKNIQFKGAARESTGRFLQLLASQLTDEAKESLLRRR